MGLSAEFSSPSSEAGLVLGCGPSCTAIPSPSISEEEPFVLTVCVPGSRCSQEAHPPALRVGAWTGGWEFLHQPSRPGSRGPGAGLCRSCAHSICWHQAPLRALGPPPCSGPPPTLQDTGLHIWKDGRPKRRNRLAAGERRLELGFGASKD